MNDYGVRYHEHPPPRRMPSLRVPVKSYTTECSGRDFELELVAELNVVLCFGRRRVGKPKPLQLDHQSVRRLHAAVREGALGGTS